MTPVGDARFSFWCSTGLSAVAVHESVPITLILAYTDFKRQITFFKFKKKRVNPIKNKKKKTTFETENLKSHVHRVISKIVLPHPQLDIKF